MPTINARIKVKDKTRCEIKASADTAEIKIIGEIDWWRNNSETFIAQMEAIKAAGIKTLNVYINSGGGSVWEANEIYNQLVNFEGEKFLELGAICASAATIPVMAFKKENTTGASNLQLMVHNPRTSVFDAEVKDLETGIQLLTNIKETISKLYQKRTGLGKTQISNKMDATWWLTAEGAKENGFIGSIKGESDLLPEDTGDVFNKYNFHNIPTVLNSALTKPEDSTVPIPDNKNSNETFTITMKDFLKLLLATVTGLTNYVKNDASEADIVAGLNKAFQEKDTKILELTNDVTLKKDKIIKLEADAKAQNDLAIKNALKAAVEAKKITPDQEVEFTKQAEKIGLDGITAILNTMTPRTSIKNAIENGGGSENKKDNSETGKPISEMSAEELKEAEESKRKNLPKNSQAGIALKMAQMNAKAAGK